MYLIKVEMNIRNPEVRYALGNCQRMHNLTTKFFDSDRKTSDILYRTRVIGPAVCLYMYANQPVDTVKHEKYRVQQIDYSSRLSDLQAGQSIAFDLIAAPSKKVHVEGKANSQRRSLRTPQERIEWLYRKGMQNGFQILHVSELEGVNTSGSHKAECGGNMYHNGYHYQGVLKITDVEVFRKAVREGIGPGKAYGFGMLMLR